MNEISIDVIAKDLASKVLKHIDQNINQVGKTAEKNTSPLSGFGGALSNVFSVAGGIIVSQVFTRISGGIGDLASNAIQGAISIEQLEIAFTTMLGSGEKAKDLIGEITEAAKKTPFELPQLQTGAKNLLAFGFAQKEIIPTLMKVGNVASGVGANFEELSQLYGTFRVQNKIFTQDLRQLTARGIPILSELAKQFKTNEQGVLKFAEQGKISFKNIEQAFDSMTGKGGRFNGLMEKQAQSLGGILSNIKDTIFTTSVAVLEQTGAFDLLKSAASGFMALFNMLSEKFTAFVNHVREKFAPQFERIKTLFSEFGGKIQDVLGNSDDLKESLMTAADAGIGFFLEMVTQLLVKLNEFGTWLKDNPEEVTKIANSIKLWAAGVMYATEKMGSLINKAQQALKIVSDLYYMMSNPAAFVIKQQQQGAFANIGKSVSTAKPKGTKFAEGGVVGGSSRTGDKVMANLNSGEVVLNEDQQKKALDKMNSKKIEQNFIFHNTKVDPGQILNLSAFYLNALT